MANDGATNTRFTVGGNIANDLKLQLSQKIVSDISGLPWMEDCIDSNGPASFVVGTHDTCPVNVNQKVTSPGPISVFDSLEAISTATADWNCVNKDTTLNIDATSVYTQPVISGQSCN